MMTEFPRLLVATEFPPNAAGGGAAIVRQMLREWPAEKLFWWSCFPDNNRQLTLVMHVLHAPRTTRFTQMAA